MAYVPNNATAISADTGDGIMCAVGIGDKQDGFRIIPPLAINQKTVVVIAFWQINGCFPDSVPAFVELDWLLRPARKVAYQQHVLCFRRGDGEPLLSAVLANL